MVSLDSQPISGFSVSSQFLLDNVQCTGNEDSLLNCSRNQLGNHNCDQSSGAGVRCGGMYVMMFCFVIEPYTMVFNLASCGDGDIRICPITDGDCVISASEQYLIDDRLSVGRVEVCLNGRYGTVCDDVWTDEAASVACGELGFSRYGTHTDHCHVFLLLCIPA